MLGIPPGLIPFIVGRPGLGIGGPRCGNGPPELGGPRDGMGPGVGGPDGFPPCRDAMNAFILELMSLGRSLEEDAAVCTGGRRAAFKLPSGAEEDDIWGAADKYAGDVGDCNMP